MLVTGKAEIGRKERALAIEKLIGKSLGIHVRGSDAFQPGMTNVDSVMRLSPSQSLIMVGEIVKNGVDIPAVTVSVWTCERTFNAPSENGRVEQRRIQSRMRRSRAVPW